MTQYNHHYFTPGTGKGCERPAFRAAAGCLALGLALVLGLALLLPAAVQAATVPQIASAMGREMDRQIGERFGDEESRPRSISLSITTPTDINDLEYSNPLARQMREELARFFVQAGYSVQEIRKGKDVLVEPHTGEMLLTRKERLLGNRNISSTAIVAGTYTVTPENVRFNINIVRADNREVLAMSTQAVPMTRELAALVGRGPGGTGALGGTPIEPTVITLLP